MNCCEWEPNWEPIIITLKEADTRIDKILASRFLEVRSRTYFQYLISSGRVRINGFPIKKQARPNEGDLVEVQFLLTPELDVVPENIPLDILYEDDHIIAINKPAGMVVHPAPGHWTGTFVNALLHHCHSLQGAFSDGSTSLRPGIVHRLDKETSGVLIAAKTPLAHQRLVEMFSGRRIQKVYKAICLGNPGSGEIITRLGRHPIHRKMMAVLEEGGKEAITQFETLCHDDKLSLVRLTLITGRTHQIRLHMRHRGAPVLGDSTYGNIAANQRFGAPRQMLHAESITFNHPITGAPLVLVAPMSSDMQEKCHALINTTR